MTRFTFILIGTVGVLFMVCNVNGENVTIEQIYDMAQNIVQQTNEWQKDLKHSVIDGRKSKFFPFGGLLPFHALCELKSIIINKYE